MDAPDIEAKITFLRTEDGGRRGPAKSGYRPQFYFDGKNYDAAHEYPKREFVYPGETVHVLLRFARPGVHLERIHLGMPFEIREGPNVVGLGEVTKILHLRQSAKNKSAKA